MDIVYLVGKPGLSHNGQELRWSLRSVAKHARNIGRVIVAGYPPDWLGDTVVRHPVEDREEYKFWQIWRKLFSVIDAGLVSGEFLVSADDHFYSRPVDLDETPFYYRRLGILPFDEQRSGGSGYRRMLAETREMLVRNGLPARDCAGHCNFRVDTEDEPAVRKMAEGYKGNRYYGFDLASCFINARAMRQHIAWKHRGDWKVRELVPEAVESGQFSCDDEAFGNKPFMEYMAREFGSPCRYEKECV